MAVHDLINQFLGGGGHSEPNASSSQNNGRSGNPLGNLPGGLVGGAAAGGIMGLLVGSKKARKFAGKAAAVGGVALLGGLAYRGYQNWKQKQNASTAPAATPDDVSRAGAAFTPTADAQRDTLAITIVKAMIAAAKADGHIDATEQGRIFEAVDGMELPAEEKGLIFDSLRRDIPISELAGAVTSLEQKSEVYLASCLAIDVDHPGERAWLDRLAHALELPSGLPQHLERQAREGLAE